MIAAFRARGHAVDVHAPGGDSIVDPGAVSGRTRLSSLLSMAPGALVELGEVVYGHLDAMRGRRRALATRPDVVYARHAVYTRSSVAAARAVGVPLLLEVNAPLALERSGDELRGLHFERLAKAWERACFDAADRLLVVSSPLRDYLLEQGVETPVEVIPNAIHTELYAEPPAGEAIRAQWGIEPDAVVVGFVGFIRAWHGVDGLLRAVDKIARERDGARPPVVLLVIGDGPALPELRAAAAEMCGPAQVVFTGRVDHAEIPPYLGAMDITVSPKTTFYACPLKLLEYLAAGTAVVAPHSANILDVVEPDVDALTFPPDDEEALTDAVRRLVNDESLRQRVGQRGRARVLEERTWDHNARRVEALVDGRGV